MQHFELSLSDAFNDTLFEILPNQQIPSFNELEQLVYDRTSSIVLGENSVEQLPMLLPSSTAILLEKLTDPEVSVEEITEVIFEDPVMTTEVLRLANSAYFNATGKHLKTINESVIRLGYNNLKAILSNILLKPMLQVKPIYLKTFASQLWIHSQDCAFACSKLATGPGVYSVSAYILGLIHDVGKIVLLDSLLQAFNEVDPSIQPRPYVFAKIVSEHGEKISHVIARSWKLPTIFLDALREQDLAINPDARSAYGKALYYGNFFSEMKLIRQNEYISDEVLEECLSNYGLDAESFRELNPFEDEDDLAA